MESEIIIKKLYTVKMMENIEFIVLSVISYV